MKRIFVIAETANYEKLVLLNYPLSKEFFEYLYTNYNTKKNLVKDLDNLDISEELSDFDIYLKLFILDKHVNQNFIFDIIINKERFISFPLWFSKGEYNKRMHIKKQYENYLKDLYNTKNNNNTKEKYILLNMFNIIFVLSNEGPMNINRELCKSVYSNLESISKLLLLEEYHSHYLGLESFNIIKNIKNYFRQKKECINYQSFIDIFQQDNNFYTYIKNIYEGIKNNEISNVKISNIELNYYIGMYNNQINSFKIKPYHCIIINRKKLDIFFQSMKDINPKILIIIDKIYQMKTLEEISLEKNIELNFVLFFANQLVSWNLARIIFKFNNYSTFQVSDKIPDEIIKFKLPGEKIELQTIINILNKFSISESTTTLNEIFKATKPIEIDEFKRCIIYLVENQYLDQTSIVIISKLKIKSAANNYHHLFLKKFSDLFPNQDILNLPEKLNLECDINEYKEIYYENFLKLVKNKSIKDFNILANIKDFIHKNLYLNEISYYTGYKIKDILDVVNKYDDIFDLVVVPL